MDLEKRGGPEKTLGRNANDGDGMTANENGFPQDCGVTAEAGFPVVVTQYHYRVGARHLAFGTQNESPRSRGDTHHGEEITAYVSRLDRLGCTVRGQAVLRVLRSHQTAENKWRHVRKHIRRALFNFCKLLIRELSFGVFTGLREFQIMHLVRVLDGQRPQDQPIHHAEDGRIRSDAESEREHDNAKEPWTPAQLPQSVAEILD